MKHFISSLFLGACLLSTVQTEAQCRQLSPDSLQLVTNGSVTNIQQSGDTLYFGGQYTCIGKYTGSLSAINSTTGDPLDQPIAAKFNGKVTDIVEDGNGGFIVCGLFTHVNNTLRRGIAKIDANGQLSPWDPNANSNNYGVNDFYMSLIRYGNTVIVAGYYDVLNGNHISPCGLDINTGQVVWNPTSGGNGLLTSTMALKGDTLFCQNQNIDVYDLSTMSTTPFSSISVASSAMAIGGDTLYIGSPWGAVVNGQPILHLMACDLNTMSLVPWNPAPSDKVNTLAVSGDTLFVGGAFYNIGGQPRWRVAALNRKTGAALNWGTNIFTSAQEDEVSTILVKNDKVYIGGNFNFMNGEARMKVAAVTRQNGTLTTFVSHATHDVVRLRDVNNKVFAGGNFNGIGCKSRWSLSAYKLSTAKILDFNPKVNGLVRTLAKKGNVLYVGGSFSEVGGLVRSHVASVNASTGTVLSWAPVISGSSVTALYVGGGRLYMSGFYESVDWQPRDCLASFNLNTGAVTNWNVGEFSEARSFALKDNLLFVGGPFSAVNGVPQQCLAALDTLTGSVFTPFAPVITSSGGGATVNTMLIDNNKLYFAGNFSAVNGLSRGKGAAIDLSTYALESFDPIFSGQVSDLDKNGSSLFFTGDFYSAFTAPHKGIVEYDPTNGIDQPWSLTGNPEIWLNAAAFSSGKMIVAGTVDGLIPIALNSIAIFDSMVSPFINITASQTNIIGCETVTLTSNSFPLNYPGINNQYEWYINGSAMGVNDTIITYYPTDGDEVVCIQTFLGNDCYSSATDTSNIIVVNIVPQLPTIDIDAPPVVVVGDPVLVTATITNAGTNYSIDWKNNGSLFATTSVPEVIYTKAAGQDIITAEVTSVDCNTSATSDEAIVNEPTSVGNKHLQDETILISPNPFKNIFTISGLEAGDNIVLINAIGQILLETRSNSSAPKTIELAPGWTGSCWLKIISNTGRIKNTTLLQRL